MILIELYFNIFDCPVSYYFWVKLSMQLSFGDQIWCWLNPVFVLDWPHTRLILTQHLFSTWCGHSSLYISLWRMRFLFTHSSCAHLDKKWCWDDDCRVDSWAREREHRLHRHNIIEAHGLHSIIENMLCCILQRTSTTGLCNGGLTLS